MHEIKNKYMQNRDLSWLKFNRRVLEESNYKENPLLERLKFVAISANNLTEFFMIRVGSITDYLLFAPDYYDNKTGMRANEILEKIYKETIEVYTLIERRFFDVTEQLKGHGIDYVAINKLSEADLKKLQKYFEKNISSLLSPQIIGKQHPFPHIDNKVLQIAVELEKNGDIFYGLLPVPKTIDRIVLDFTTDKINDSTLRYILLEDLIYHFAHLSFKPYKLQEKTVLSVTRNADLDFAEVRKDEEELDYPKFMRKLLNRRQKLAAVRLELQYDIDKGFKDFLLKQLRLKEYQVFSSKAPLDLSYCFGLSKKINSNLAKELMWKPHVPHNIYSDKNLDFMSLVQKKDIFLFFPFESMSPFLRMLNKASDDDQVISIKITLYRLDMQSKLADSLIRAAENDKEVIVIMELRARFDEANNISWANKLEEAGCKVVYGLEEYKVHSKICIITKSQQNKITRITQIGTGNYNEQTAKIYTDFSLITSNEDIGNDAVEFFKNILLNNMKADYKKLWVAPNYFKQNIINSIQAETEKTKLGEETQIIIKCNSLTDKKIIDKLIEASQAGVKVYMIVRGSCCIIPGVAGYTDNIKVISVIGRFLEHTRIYSFGIPGQDNMYIASADLMTRNTERRVEIGCPILDPEIKYQIHEILDTLLKDNTKAWEQNKKGDYVLRKPKDQLSINSQNIFRLKISNRQQVITEEIKKPKETEETIKIKETKKSKTTLFDNLSKKIKTFFKKYDN